MNKLFNTLLTVAAFACLISAGGLAKMAGEIIRFATSEMPAVLLLGSAVYAFIARGTGAIPSRDMLRRISGTKSCEESGSDVLWRPNWRAKVSYPVLGAATASIHLIWVDAPSYVYSISVAGMILLLISATHAAVYATLFFIGKLARKGSQSELVSKTDSREAFAVWVTVVASLAAAAYIPESRGIALLIAPLIILTGWIRDVDVLRTNIPRATLYVLRKSSIPSLADSTPTSDDEDDDRVSLSRKASDYFYRWHPESRIDD